MRGKIFLGASIGGSGDRFRGHLDETAVFNRALSQSEVRVNLNHTLTGTEPGLVACWSFDEGAGTVAGDQSPAHRYGLLGAGVVSQQHNG